MTETKKPITEKEREAMQAMSGRQEGVLKGLLSKIPPEKMAQVREEIKKRVKDPKTLKVLEDCGL